jgi:RraA family protein
MSIGFRVLKRRRAADLGLARAFLDMPVANVSDCMARMVGGGSRLRPMHAGGRMAGPALTVKVRPGDNLMLHKALQMAVPGDVIVVDGSGDLSNALLGELMVSKALSSGVAGIVINGAIRDAAELRAGTLPIFAAGVTHRGPYKDGPGEINVPIALDGMVIEPGDLVIGDDDGLLCVPYDAAEGLLQAARKKQLSEQAVLQAIAVGSYDDSWVDALLAERHCFVETD